MFQTSSTDASSSESPKKRLKAAVSLCKLADWDPDVFLSVRDLFLSQVRFFVPSIPYAFTLWLSVLCMRSKAWLAAPVLLAHAEVTKT